MTLPLDLVIAILVGVLAVATAAALVLGLLGLFGLGLLTRCEHCGNALTRTQARQSEVCLYCGHQHLARPLGTRSRVRHQLLRH